ncbi:dienelactone hydrolase family protein [Blastopirellula sp. JC732]|uniref:Dienelactone hydrolase family protein n=2 Tax=Blastopirellula sediminis TaxID=2894196 RepID=A0A9X1MMD8_9BACT|nr:dienelactone hydrolase family protein [Blastopirellula sediminis]MCC9628890.1 dienelactone hydrolase family protein [Blastopirellula sediminis]
MVAQVAEVLVGSDYLPGILTVPNAAKGVVLFAHGSGSSRFSTRNQMVAEELQDFGFATLLFDLLGEDEARDRRLVFDIPLLALRLREAEAWAKEQPGVGDLPLGFFGASTGAAAALVAAALDGSTVKAVVSRGGRPDLARGHLRNVKAPTLLIVGGDDEPVLTLNRQAFADLQCAKHLEVVPHATHLFEEPGALEKVALLAEEWFSRYLQPENRI